MRIRAANQKWLVSIGDGADTKLVSIPNMMGVPYEGSIAFPIRKAGLVKLGRNEYEVIRGIGNIFYVAFEAYRCDVFARVLDADDVMIVAGKSEAIGGYIREYIVWTAQKTISVWFKRTAARPNEPKSGILVYTAE